MTRTAFTLAAGAAMALSFFETGASAQDSFPGTRVTGDHFATRAPVQARNGMAATIQPLATQAALDVLKAGGSAADAAIAANAMLGLVEPTGNGIGGDIFVLVWDPETREVHALESSGASPMSLDIETVRANLTEDGTIPPHGPLPVTVPGTVAGWQALHDRFGTLPLEEVLAPAIRYGEEGFPLTQTIAFYWARGMANFERSYESGMLPEIENARATYLLETGEAPREGEIFANPDLANTYRQIAEGGADAFYRGDIARTIDAYFERIGGWLSYDDMAAHEPAWVEPATTNYRGYDVWQMPAPNQGMAVLQMLNILEGYDLSEMGFMSPEALHVMIEAKRLAFEDRARYYADPAYADIPSAALLDKGYAEQRRALIDPEQAMQSVPFGDPAILQRNDTTYLTVADGNGMMVSLIQSNYRGMGSGLVPDGLGFMLHDRGEMFSLDDDHPNVYAPGKRPFHTIIPGMMTRDGEALMSFGLMGGAMQPQGHVQVLVNIIDFGLNLQEAGDAARWRHDGSTEPTDAIAEGGLGVVHVEAGIPETVREALEARGHAVEVSSGGFGGYQAIWRNPETGVLTGASEMRTDGQASGY
jgi:gamma-glutamyltranspeptidase/glutathione hydrolase